MPNVTLAMHLLNERYSTNSFWKPYIDSLPHEYTTPFFYHKDDLKELQSSPCLVKAIVQIRNVSKLYAHLHRLVRTTCDPSLPLFEAGFFLDDFLWAVSAVMSRQNEIPEKADGSNNVLALIPLWDLCNHTEGHMSTFYNLEEGTCDCYALEDTPTGEEFLIFYGSRANYDLLIHQGFVFMRNKSDALQIRLGLSTDDPHYDGRKKILEKLNIPVGGEFSVYCMECPFSQSLVAFTRVFTATAEELEGLLIMDQEQLTGTLFNDRWSGDNRVLSFLLIRCQILLRSYTTSLDQDAPLLDKLHTFTPYTQLAIQIRICEKRILHNAVAYARRVGQQLEALKVTQEAGKEDELKTLEGRVVPASVDRVGMSESGFVGGMLPSNAGAESSTNCQQDSNEATNHLTAVSDGTSVTSDSEVPQQDTAIVAEELP
ncbi:actin-histidine N-methyltransferase-like [Halichondria panicea]|uniref:actin-histidine N-methyltransferase-like n=1 Tax=Halichondria panicea TaxID=6063 RepID=UPI00312B7351